MSAPIEAEVAVIGGGPAGIAAAIAASRAGLEVVLAEGGTVGGRAASGTLLPWRVLERAADAGASLVDAAADVERLAALWQERLALRLADEAVELLPSRASFESERSLRLADGRQVRFDRAIVACGSSPVMLEGDALDGRRWVSPDGLLGLDALPDSVLVVGSGVAGAELADAMSRMADGPSDISWLMDDLGLLPRFDRELAESFGDVLMERGVRLVHGMPAVSAALEAEGVAVTIQGGRVYRAKLGVLALGNRAATEGLGLEAAGVKTSESGRVVTDSHCRTNLEHVFAAGECTGCAPSVAAAEAMGRCAGRRAAGSEVATYEPRDVPLVAHTRPRLAQVGRTPEDVAGQEVAFHTLRLEETLGGLLDGIGETAAKKGLVRVVCDSDSGAVLGGTAVGPGAEAMMSALALAIRLGATDEQLADVHASVPGALDALFRAAR